MVVAQAEPQDFLNTPVGDRVFKKSERLVFPLFSWLRPLLKREEVELSDRVLDGVRGLLRQHQQPRLHRLLQVPPAAVQGRLEGVGVFQPAVDGRRSTSAAAAASVTDLPASSAVRAFSWAGLP